MSIKDAFKKKHVIFSDIVIKCVSGSGWNHSFGSFQNSDQVGRGEGAEVVLSLFVKLSLGA